MKDTEKRTIPKEVISMLEISFYTAGYHDEKAGVIYIPDPDIETDTIFFRDELYMRMSQLNAIESKTEQPLFAFKKIGKLEK